jgi:hypothetical protein
MTGFCKHGDEPSRLCKRREISWLTERLLASQEGLCSMHLVLYSCFFVPMKVSGSISLFHSFMINGYLVSYLTLLCQLEILSRGERDEKAIMNNILMRMGKEVTVTHFQAQLRCRNGGHIWTHMISSLGWVSNNLSPVYKARRVTA